MPGRIIEKYEQVPVTKEDREYPIQPLTRYFLMMLILDSGLGGPDYP